MEGDLASRQHNVEAMQARIAELEASIASAANTTRRARQGLAPGEDDLLAIPGLGPVMSKALRGQGIVTYRALALMTPDQAADLGRAMGNNFARRATTENWFEKARDLHIAQYGEEI